jgi:hypothetical protein
MKQLAPFAGGLGAIDNLLPTLLAPSLNSLPNQSIFYLTHSMNLRLLIVPLLLLSTLGCSKKDDPATPAVGTGSYKVRGRLVTGQARAALQTLAPGQQTQVLYIYLSDTPTYQPTTQTVLLTFEKPVGQSTTAYQLTAMTYSPDGTPNADVVRYANDVTTISETSTGVFSGTFSGNSTSPYTGSTLSEGVFTDARL